MKQEKITCHVKLLCKNGKIDALLAALEVCARESRQESGCEYYEIVQNIEYPQQILLIEKFTSYDDFQQHLIAPVIKDFIDTKQYQFLDEMSYSLFVTRIDCTGNTCQETDLDALALQMNSFM